MDEGFCEYCGYRPCVCGGRVHKILTGKVPKYSREWYRMSQEQRKKNDEES